MSAYEKHRGGGLWLTSHLKPRHSIIPDNSTDRSSEQPPHKRSNDSRPFLTSLPHYILTSPFHSFVSTHFLHRRYQLRNLDPDYRPLARPALDVQKKIRPIQHAQPLAHVAQPDSLNVHVGHLLFRDAHTIAFNLNSQPTVAASRSQFDFSPAQLRRQPVLQAILHHGLEQHARHKRFQGGIVNLLHDVQIVFSESRHLDVQVIVDELQLLAQRHKRFVFAQQPPQNVAQLQHHAARRIRIKADQRRHGVQRVKQKMWIDLAGERIHPRFQQQLLVPFQVHLDARVVPDLQRRRHRHQRCNHYQHQPPIPLADGGRRRCRVWNRCAQGQRRRQGRHRFEFLVGSVCLGKEHRPERGPQRDRRDNGRRPPRLHQQAEQTAADGWGCIHFLWPDQV